MRWRKLRERHAEEEAEQQSKWGTRERKRGSRTCCCCAFQLHLLSPPLATPSASAKDTTPILWTCLCASQTMWPCSCTRRWVTSFTGLSWSTTRAIIPKTLTVRYGGEDTLKRQKSKSRNGGKKVAKRRRGDKIKKEYVFVCECEKPEEGQMISRCTSRYTHCRREEAERKRANE